MRGPDRRPAAPPGARAPPRRCRGPGMGRCASQATAPSLSEIRAIGERDGTRATDSIRPSNCRKWPFEAGRWTSFLPSHALGQSYARPKPSLLDEIGEGAGCEVAAEQTAEQDRKTDDAHTDDGEPT